MIIFESYMGVFDKTIEQLVDENFLYGRALYHLGIDFIDHKESKLGEVCLLRGLNRNMVIRQFYQFDGLTRIPMNEISKYPIPLLIRYLRHSHTTYIKEYLPYVGRLVDRLSPTETEIAMDLKAVFPLFMEDFIHHIYEEEDTLFEYVLLLSRIEHNLSSSIGSLLPFFSFSLEELRHHHLMEDEMTNMRELIREIPTDTLELRLIAKELMAFDRELLYHAEIEDQILFPKATELDARVWQEIQRLGSNN